VPLTASGGRLNVLKAVNTLDALCFTEGGDIAILQIVPNPVVDEAVATYRIPSNSPHDVLIYDAAGRLVMHEKPIVSTPGQQFFTINSDRMIPGVYHFTIRQDKVQQTLSFLVQ
jgi:hypothetical protein